MKKLITFLLIIISLFLVTGCSETNTYIDILYGPSKKKTSTTITETNTKSETKTESKSETKTIVEYDTDDVLEVAEYNDYVSEPDEKDEDYLEKIDTYRKYKESTKYVIKEDSALDKFIDKTIEGVLVSDKKDNILYSPLNVYLALSILAETTANDCQKELLDLLEVKSIEELENEAKKVWISVYKKDTDVITTLGSSIWLRNELKYNGDLLKKLKETFFCSSFSGVMGSEKYNEEFRKWINENTNYLLSEQVKELSFDKDTMFTIITTIYYKNSFNEAFNKAFNIEDDFYLSDQKVAKVTYMVKTYDSHIVYSGKKYTSVLIYTKDNGALKIILPNDGYSVNDLLKDKDTKNFIRHTDKAEQKNSYYLRVQVPKFDCESKTSLIDVLQNLGVNKIFNPLESDFSNLVNREGLIVDKIIHGVRVKVDENGIEGAAYTYISNKCTSTGEQLKKYSFDVTKPFIFTVMNSDETILFMGVVNNPIK